MFEHIMTHFSFWLTSGLHPSTKRVKTTEDSTKILALLTHVRSSRGRHVSFKGRWAQRPRNWTCFMCMRLATTDVCTLLPSRVFTFYDSRIYIYSLCDSGTLSIWRKLHMVSLYSGRVCIYLTMAELCVIFNLNILSFDDRKIYVFICIQFF
jgi:hypothetical protein